MTSRKLVAVSQRVDIWPERNERRDALDQRIATWLTTAGFTPVPVPNCLLAEDLLEQFLEVVQPVSILLSGGNDIGEIPERDLTENRLLDWAETHLLPVLGICRGMQMMAVRAGAILNVAPGHVRTRHILHGRLSHNVNSFHSLALDQCPLGFSVLAYAEDDRIEAIHHQTLPWEGWMWHPEREASLSPADLSRCRTLFGAKKTR